MYGNKKINLIAGISICSAAFVPSLVSCEVQNTPINNLTIGSSDGTDWEGYKSGLLLCVRSNSWNVSYTYPGIQNGACIFVDNDYEAENLVIPDMIKFPNGDVLPLVLITDSFDSGFLTGSLTIGKYVTTITNSFNQYKSPTKDLIIPNDVINVGSSFNAIDVNKIYLGDSVECVDESFLKCQANEIGISEYNQWFGLATNVGSQCQAIVYKEWSTPDKCLFDWKYNNLLGSLAVGNIVIPDDVKTIGSRSGILTDCKGIKGSLNTNNVMDIWNNSFCGCSFDGKLTLGSNLVVLNSEVFDNSNFSSVEVSSSNTIYGNASNVGENCTAVVLKEDNLDLLVDYSNPNSVVNNLMFGTLQIPGETVSISPELIKKCTGIKGIELSASNNSQYVLVQSDSGELTPTGSISAEHSGFMLDKADIPNVEDDSDMGITNEIPYAIGDIVIPDYYGTHKITYIGNPVSPETDGDGIAFGFTKLSSITTGENLTHIYGSSFRNCLSLTKLDLPNVESIYNSAFESEFEEKPINEVSIPSITYLNEQAFERQYNIVSITVNASVDPAEFIFGTVFWNIRDNKGKLTNSSTDGTYKNAWKSKLGLGSWEWTN